MPLAQTQPDDLDKQTAVWSNILEQLPDISVQETIRAAKIFAIAAHQLAMEITDFAVVAIRFDRELAKVARPGLIFPADDDTPTISDEELLATYEPFIRSKARSTVRKCRRLSAADVPDLEQEMRLKLTSIPQEKRHIKEYCRTVCANRAGSYRDELLEVRDPLEFGDAPTGDLGGRTVFDQLAVSGEAAQIEARRQLDQLKEHITPLQWAIIALRHKLNPEQRTIWSWRRIGALLRQSEYLAEQEYNVAIAKMRRLSTIPSTSSVSSVSDSTTT